MKTIFFAFFLISTLLLAGCAHQDTDSGQLDCTEAFLAANDMIAYEGQDLGCSFFMSKYLYQDRVYFLLGNPCADMIAYPTDCENNRLCDDFDWTGCEDFFEEAVYLGIVGIRL